MAAMNAPAWGKALLGRANLNHTAAAAALPGFLVPAWQRASGSSSMSSRQQFSTTSKRPSKLGRTPISVPPGVEVSVGDPITIRSMTSYKPVVKKIITVKGPLGELHHEVPEFVNLEQDLEARKLALSVLDPNVTSQKEMWGTSWSYINNNIMGVSEGHTAILRLVGVGYRATVEPRGAKEEYPGQLFLCLKLGFTHPVEEGIPKGVKATIATPTRILLEGTDRVAIMSFAGKVRLWRRPEPYKGKGIFINDETIKLKGKKIK